MHSRGNHQQNKNTTPTEWENIFADISSKGLIPKMYKELTKLNTKKTQQTTQLKNGQRTWIDISPKRTYGWSIDMKRWSMSLITREMQVKTTMRYQLTLVRMAIINKSINNKCWQWCGERGTLLHCWWECRLVQPLWKAVWRYLKILKMDLPFDPVISLLGIYLKQPKTLI